MKTGEARIFKIGQDRTLRSIIDVDLGGQADNVNVIPSTGDLMYAGEFSFATCPASRPIAVP